MPIGIVSTFTKEPAVYILASKRNEHKQGEIDGFTKRYDVKRLAYIEFHDSFDQAFKRETRLKKWNRAWKVRLIEQMNPQWDNLWLPSGELLMFGPGGQIVPDGD